MDKKDIEMATDRTAAEVVQLSPARTGALNGIRVLDVSRVLAGPYCGQLLADNGADVIKVEPPEGDLNRRFMPLVNGDSANFLSVNRGKSMITLNLRLAEARDLMHAIAKTCDVVLQNFLPDAAKKLGTDYETMSAVNADLIHVTISGYGARGALRSRPGYDMMVNAFAGIMSVTGEPDGKPVRSGVSALDMSTGMMAYGAVTTALLARAMGKARGQRIELSLLETAVSLTGYHAVNWLHAGHLVQREGGSFATIVPYGVHACQDGDILIGATTEAAWRKICQVIGAPELIDDPRFASNATRLEHVNEVRAALEAVLTQASVEHWVDLLDAAGVACAPIHPLDVALAHPQVAANDMIMPAPTRDGGSIPLIGLPFKMSGTPGQLGAAPPPTGADTDTELARVLGLSGEQIAGLRERGVV